MAILAQLVDDVIVHKHALASDTITLGRHLDNAIVIDDSAVSATHTRVFQTLNEYFPDYKEYYVEDAGSTNGTYVNDLRIEGRQRLHNNDVIRLAWNKFKFIDDKPASMDKTVHILSKTQ
ncbi:FHA domain-containing protein [Teredinibacter purpureus]|jgi:FOG: FHA domain|uniref:FHA domain-containing protein n=1 Tax=Teredinibacter purpureus TaxID=2731756 RepID=UPI0005F83117|nr:FHA domain-containing protein [Teredinibacter purpureus]